MALLYYIDWFCESANGDFVDGSCGPWSNIKDARCAMRSRRICLRQEKCKNIEVTLRQEEIDIKSPGGPDSWADKLDKRSLASLVASKLQERCGIATFRTLNDTPANYYMPCVLVKGHEGEHKG